MRLSNALNEKKMDRRLRDKLLAEGKLNHEEVKKLLEELPDDSENMTWTEVRPTQDS